LFSRDLLGETTKNPSDFITGEPGDRLDGTRRLTYNAVVPMRNTEQAAQARKDWASAIGDFFLPPACLSCGGGRARVFEGGVCRACWEALPVPAGPRCDVCDLPIASPGAAALASPRCGRCLEQPPAFDRLRAAFAYSGTAAAVLKAFKYGGADRLAPHLAQRIAPVLDFDRSPEAAVPIPSTRRERRERGFFPAGDLAECLARRLGLAYTPAMLWKNRETERQARLSLSRRAANVKGAFSARRPPECVLLVDDVATSGATLSAASRALKGAGAKVVFAAAFARALPEEP
jgi:predicted amidophosphoribosyltransferase